MKIVLIRHGATAGNIKKRYIGITDEDLCASGIESIHNNIKAGENVQGRKDTVSRCLCQSGYIENDRNPGIMHK